LYLEPLQAARLAN